MPDLATVEAVKEYLIGTSPADSSDDALIGSLLSAVSADFLRATKRDAIVAQEFTEIHSGTGSCRMYPNRDRVVSVKDPGGVMVDGVTIPKRSGYTGSGWVLDGECVALVGYSFTRGVANVVLTYTAGLPEIPDDIAQAVVEQTARAYMERHRLGQSSKNLGGESVTYFQPGSMSPFVKGVIERHTVVDL